MADSIITKLARVQNKLKAPKNLNNNFGNYKYRSCEAILEAVKPLLAKEDLAITISDKVVNIGDRYYVKATAKVISTTETYWVDAYAREDLSKKGMDVAQVTGAASSYARKYALNGLFAIDDTKDADATNDHQSKAVPPEKAMTQTQLTEITKILNDKGIKGREDKIIIMQSIAGDEPLNTSAVERLKKEIQNTEPDTLQQIILGA